ncbi:hypothetical protein HZ326_19677 [Fusarium oxysporum f. sp. albedinis]|nr:hypothetical protein HZ326_19677 [Fusarium oxysporum f. sp. albedinis]
MKRDNKENSHPWSWREPCLPSSSYNATLGMREMPARSREDSTRYGYSTFRTLHQPIIHSLVPVVEASWHKQHPVPEAEWND